jgi:hypothetical protein
VVVLAGLGVPWKREENSINLGNFFERGKELKKTRPLCACNLVLGVSKFVDDPSTFVSPALCGQN